MLAGEASARELFSGYVTKSCLAGLAASANWQVLDIVELPYGLKEVTLDVGGDSWVKVCNVSLVAGIQSTAKFTFLFLPI